MGQKATRNISEFRSKKQSFLDECLSHLINDLKQEILFKSSLGSLTLNFDLNAHEDKFPELIVGTEDRPQSYKLKTNDRQYLHQKLVEHFQDKTEYPALKCHSTIRGLYQGKFSVRVEIQDPDDIEETKESDEETK